MSRYFTSLLAVIVLGMAATWLWVIYRPMAFLASDYPIWTLKKQMAGNLPPSAVVILGDSRAMADFLPSRIGPHVVNLGCGGATSIDTFALSRIILSSPHPPSCVILSLCAQHCMETDSFWNHSVKYGLLDWKTIEEVRAHARRTNDLAEWTDDPNQRAPLFGPVTVGDIEVRLKIALYSIRFPSFYFPSLIAGGFYQREAYNLFIYDSVQKARGFSGYGNKPGCQQLSEEAKLAAFAPSPLFDSYLSATIALFQSKNIPVYFIVAPISDISGKAVRTGFTADYATYIKAFETRYPNFHRLGEPLPTMSWTYFNDANHLSEQGAQVFSDRVAALLSDAPIEK